MNTPNDPLPPLDDIFDFWPTTLADLGLDENSTLTEVKAAMFDRMLDQLRVINQEVAEAAAERHKRFAAIDRKRRRWWR